MTAKNDRNFVKSNGPCEVPALGTVTVCEVTYGQSHSSTQCPLLRVAVLGSPFWELPPVFKHSLAVVLLLLLWHPQGWDPSRPVFELLAAAGADFPTAVS